MKTIIMVIGIVIMIFCARRIVHMKTILDIPSYAIPAKPLPQISNEEQREIDTQRRMFKKQAKEQEQLKKRMIREKKYLQYKIVYPTHLDDYANIPYDFDRTNPLMYETILPISQEFYYKGQKYYIPEDWLKHITQNYSALKEAVHNYSLNMSENDLKHNMINIWKYNNCARFIIEQCIYDIEFYKDNGYLKKVK